MTGTRRAGAQKPDGVAESLHTERQPKVSDAQHDGRQALGTAFVERLHDIADIQIALVGDDPRTHAVSVTASKAFASWLLTGKADLPSIDEITRDGASVLIQDQTSLRQITRLTLGWRDAVMFVLREEAERLTIADEVLQSALDAVRQSADAFAVQFAAQYDRERLELKLQLAESKEELVHRATHDPLTGLDNRSSFFEHLEGARGPEPDHNESVVVLFVDLDRFKVINDQFGHAVGDRLLQAVADRLRNVVRPGDTLSRLGGDEFVILCGGIKEADAPEIALQVARRVAAAFSTAFVVGEAALSMTASIGIAIQHCDAGDGEEIVAAADAAMYIAKERRRPGCEIEMAR